MKTVIIGNGIVALSTAFRLLQRSGRNDQIAIVGPLQREGSATWAAAAMLNSFAEIEAGSLETELDLYRFELSHLATRLWPKFEIELIDAAGSSLPAGCAKCEGCTGGGCFSSGTYIVNNTNADDLDDDNFDAILAALDRFNEQHQRVSPQDIPGYKPDQRCRATRAVHIPREGWFNPRLMLEKLDGILRKAPQVTFHDATANRLIMSSGSIERVELADGGKIYGDRFLVACGATISSLLDRSKLGLDIQRVFYGVGVSVQIQPVDTSFPNCIRTPNRGLACGLYAVPYFLHPDNRQRDVLIGGTSFMSPEPRYRGQLTSVESLMRGAMEQINADFYRAEVVCVNVGWRPTSTDTYPLLGKTSIGNLLVASGTKRDGFHMAPVISEKLVQMLLNEPVDERFHWFAPERRPIRALTREQAISRSTRHLVSAAYQLDFSPPKGRMRDQIRQMYRDDLERLHDQVNAVDWGIPPEMIDMYRYGHAH